MLDNNKTLRENFGLDTFWENNKTYINSNGVLSVILLVVGILYHIECEFLFYGISFFIIITIITSLFHNADIVKKKEKEERIITDRTDEEKWEKYYEKEDFFALWTHQIKTPIAALNLLFSDEEVDTGSCKRELIKIEHYVEIALNYLKFEEMQDIVLDTCSLEHIVKQSVKKYSTIFIYQHLSVELDNLNCNILTDEKWFSFVFDQILSNALKYTKKGRIKIYREVFEDRQEIAINDTGIGIKSEDIPRVFDKGYTGFNGRMDKKASGIGLYLCKGVCDRLGHKLKITSCEGKGTEVRIILLSDRLESSDLTKM